MPDLDAVISKAISGAESAAAATETGGPAAAGGDSIEAADPGETAELDTAADTTTEGDEPAVEAGDDPAKPAAATTEEETPDLTTVELAGQTIPVSRHKAVLTKARKATEALQKDLADLAWAKAPETQQKLRALEIADQQPDLFVQELLKDEKLGPMLRKAIGVQGTEEPAAAAQPAGRAATAPTERPQPDALLPDGSPGYSADQSAALIAYELGQFEQKVTKQLEERFGKVEPVVKQYEAAQSWNQAIERQTGALNDARSKWPGFKQHEAAVREHLFKAGNENVGLLDAYMAVVVPKMQGDAATIRKEILAEMNTRPAAAHPGPRTTTGAAPATQGGDKIENAIRNAIARAESATA